MIMEKEVFERMLSEFNELNERVTKCREFLLDEEKSKVLDALNRDLLVAQLKAMEAYLSILSVRIGLNAPREELAQPADTEETVVSEAVND
jgi:hypothetical protein